MNRKIIVTTALVALAMGLSGQAIAGKGQWKKGRIYYQMVCTECHINEANRKISPAEKTRAEWAEYFQADRHHAGDDKPASYYVSSEFRNRIKDQNRAAMKMLKLPDAQLLEDVKAFTEYGAKDSDQPATCK